MKTIDFSYFIERYNAGEMNDAEKQWFLRELEGNKTLREEVELRKKADDVLTKHPTLMLRNKLREIERQRAEVVPPVNRRKNFTIRYAAVISVLVLLGSLMLIPEKQQPVDELVQNIVKPYEAISASRSSEAIGNEDYKTGLEYFIIHDYSTAAGYFSKVLLKNPGDMESTLLYGVSNFEVKNYPDATNSFTKVVDNNDNLYIEDAQWYLAMCYMLTEERNDAIRQLEMIIKSKSIYRKEARRALRGLR